MPISKDQESIKAKIFGVTINRLSWGELDEYCQNALLEDSPKHIITANGEILLKASEDSSYGVTLKGADLVIPESTNVAWVLALKGKPVKQITSGADLAHHLARIAADNQKSIFLLGGQEGIAAKAGKRLQQMNPGLNIAGFSNADPDNLDILKHIKSSGADIVLVAYGAPKQEEWIAKHKNELGAKILVGIGGTFDMLAGVTPRAPQLFRYLHLEWLWRLILQPSRIGRIWRAVVAFPIKALFSG
ncbi:MAG: WecB/TagA/CpsF family glycosyltransferase [bacterium]|nr:WecB/TagA/CpsF family glycosyltransferase [bacterium]